MSSSVPPHIHSCLHRDEEADFSSHLRHYLCVCLCMCLWWYTTGGDRRKIYYCLVFLNRSSAVTKTQLTSFWMHRKTVSTSHNKCYETRTLNTQPTSVQHLLLQMIVFHLHSLTYIQHRSKKLPWARIPPRIQKHNRLPLAVPFSCSSF